MRIPDKPTVPTDEEIANDIAPMFIPADDGVFIHLTPDQLSAYVRQVRDRTREADIAIVGALAKDEIYQGQDKGAMLARGVLLRVVNELRRTRKGAK